MLRILCFVALSLLGFLGLAQQDEEANHLYQKGYEALQAQQVDSANYYFKEYLTKVEDNERYELFVLHIGTLYRTAREFEKASYYFDVAKITPQTKDDSILLVDLYSEKGLLYYDQSLFAFSLLELTKSLEIAHHLNDSIGLSIAYINTGNVFKDIGDYALAEEYYNRALDYSMNAPNFKVKALNNLGATYLEIDDYVSAKDLLEQSLALASEYNYPFALVDALINLAIIDVKENHFEAAKDQFEEAISLTDSLSDLNKKLLCAINLYHIYHLENDRVKAKEFEQISLDLINEISEPTAELELYEYLSDNYYASGELAQAYHYQDLLLQTKEALYEEEKLIYEKQIKFNLEYNQALTELKMVEAELNFERSAKEEVIHRNDELSTQNLWIILLSLITVLLLLTILIILIRAYKKKSHYSTVLALRSEELTEKNEQIINSREYANSMERLLIQQMNPHFIFNCLTTIEASIGIGNVDYAKEYLLLFSSLLRKTLDNSRTTSIPLIEEINFLKDYVSFNQFGQESHFICDFIYDEEEVNDFVNTPAMLIQPFVENAIFHGLYHKTDGEKKMSIQVEPKERVIVWTITDNGIGRKKATEIKKQHPGVSHGTKITSDRISWMQNIYQQQLSIVYEDLEEGTRVIIQTPILDS